MSDVMHLWFIIGLAVWFVFSISLIASNMRATDEDELWPTVSIVAFPLAFGALWPLLLVVVALGSLLPTPPRFRGPRR